MENFLTPEERLRYLVTAMRRNESIKLRESHIDYESIEMPLCILFEYKNQPKRLFTVSTTILKKGFSVGQLTDEGYQFKYYENDLDIYQL